MKKFTVLMSIVAAIVAVPLFAQTGTDAYHAGQYANCSDCHTMHASIHNNQTDGSAVTTTPTSAGGTGLNIWLPVQGDAEHYLLKGTEAGICITCHDGKSFAPDVVGATNSFGTSVRSAGFLNGSGGHQLGSTVAPPGFDPATIGATGAATNVYDSTHGLMCISCHGAHGSKTVYRQLAPYSWGTQNGGPGIRTNVQPARNLSATPLYDGTVDVNINQAAFVPGTASYYDATTITYAKRASALVGQTTTNNRYDTFCAACHGQFHGGATGQGATATTLDTNGNVFDDAAKLFVRHPTAGVVMGTRNADLYNGITTPAGLKAGWQKAPLYLAGATAADVANSTPGCVSCHKAHGNNNPFALLYIGPGALTEGGSDSGTYVSLCHQCHSMGGL